MKASYNWLKEYVDFELSPEMLADRLTMAGVPVETISDLGAQLDQVVTGKLLSVVVHPNADKLFVCKVDVGAVPVTIVTGATNVETGQIVPVALPGAKLPGGKEIQEAPLRGILSHGMLCSAAELGIDAKLLSAEAREGIFILPPDTSVGQDIRQVLGLDDFVLEFELTANRADCFCMLGLAREIAVLTAAGLKKPMLNLRETGSERTTELISISIAEPELCSRFTGRVLQNVRVFPSPAWMQQRLRAAGMRPINNVVDVTNYVMLELGQPMHAYDYDLLAKRSLVVRRAQPGEKLTTLDGVKRDLTPEMLVIADAVQAVGIAGVMGGLVTEVTSSTHTVLLEAAAFHAASIRRTARALGLRSEASGRFERGVDVANVVQALDRAAKLLEDMGACTVCPTVADVYPRMAFPRQLEFSPQWINSYLGTEIARDRMVDILDRLEFQTEDCGDSVRVTVPSWRADVARPADISEEIARIVGFDAIKATTPFGMMEQGRQSYRQTIRDRVQELMAAMGFDEMISLSFMHPATLDKLNVAADSELRRAIPVLNPITDEFPVLRTTLLGGLLQAVALNLSRKNENLQLYELGAVYLPSELPLTELPQEPLQLAAVMLGRRENEGWCQLAEPVDFFDAKGAVEQLLFSLGIACGVAGGEHYAMHPGKTAIFSCNGQVVATVGELHPQVLEAYGFNRKLYVLELDMEAVAANASLIGSYRSLPRFPAISRDLAVVLDAGIGAERVETEILASGGPLLQEVRLFDVYTGEQVPAGMRSLAFTLTFRAADRTLTDEEVEGYNKTIVDRLASELSAKLRLV
ncbi:MAG: phenylalanine--tRNA ligase subunit beta [Sporomusaceae bacterium]|nr:phenylalanine--tRNA ligase subunit beta [Sporomusaceae bacterium]